MTEVPVGLADSSRRYTSRMRYALAFLLFGAAEILAGCGQKGPLVHPDAHKPKVVTPSAPAAPSAAGASPVSTTQKDDAKPVAAPQP
jgi:predicted small lipoprotein YifL